MLLTKRMKTSKSSALVVPLLITAFSLVNQVAFAGTKDVEIETAYHDDQGNLIVRFDYKDKILGNGENPEFFDTNLTFYGNQKGLYQQEETGFGGTSTQYHLSFYDPSGSGDFYAGVDTKDIFKPSDEYRLVCGEKSKLFEPASDQVIAQIQSQIRSGKIPLHPLPTSDRQPEYVFKAKDNSLWVYVDAAKLNYSYESYRLFVGSLKAMKEYKIKDVERYRDGGTTYITLKNGGVLFSPTPFERNKPATLSNASGKVTELETLDHRSFDVSQFSIKGVPTPATALKTPCELLR